MRYLAYCILAAYLCLVALQAAHPVRLDLLPNGCLVNALEFELTSQAQRGLEQVTWARLVTIAHQDWFKFTGHAMCVYSLRNGDLWVYDINNGSLKLDTKARDLRSVAAALHRMDRRIWYVRYID